MTALVVPADLAARAWALVTGAERMDPRVAVDWLREQCGDTDDVVAVKRALYGAAADALLAARPEGGDGAGATDLLRGGRLDAANSDVNGSNALVSIRRWCSPPYSDPPKELWLAWCDRFAAACALCRLVEGA